MWFQAQATILSGVDKVPIVRIPRKGSHPMPECPGSLKCKGGEGVAERRWRKTPIMCNDLLMLSLAPSQHIWELDAPIKPTPIKSA